MAEFSEGEAEVEGEEFEGEDVGQSVGQTVPVVQEPPPESELSNKKKVKGKRKKAPPPIRINLSACKYEVLRIVQRKLGWKEVGDDDDWEIYWTDTSVSIERIMKLTKVQKINHFSGMLEICRKRAMARNLMKMARQFPQHFDFFPRTFILPGDKDEFLADIRARGKKQVYILKPDAGCQGRGIRLVQGGKEEVVTRVLSEMATPNVVAQHYLSSPLLIHGYKFDLRIYALVLSCDPLRVFLFHEGLARICTEKYSPPKASNLDVSFMHLTNYAVNKKNEAFVAAVAANGDGGEDASKWCLAQLRQYITSLGHDYDKVWSDIGDLIIKSLCSVQPILRNNYRSVLPPDNDGFSCFEILGYDIMLDDQLRPWLIEVNHSPSFNIDSPLDLAIKEELITQTIKLVRVDPKIIAKTKKAEKRAATSRLLEPMHIKKPPAGRQTGPPAAGAGGAGSGSAAGAGAVSGGAAAGAAGGSGGGGGGGGSSSGQADGKGGAGEGEEGACSGGGVGAASSAAFFKPRTPEEYEAWRAKVLAARERYESKHMGNFTRICPSPDPAKQALYEELLKGANEIFQASFARNKRPDPTDEKKRREDMETESQKAERLKAKAHRDNLAQKAVERRKFKLLEQQRQQGIPLPAYLASPQPYLQPAGSASSSASQQEGPLGGGHGMPYYIPMPLGPYQYDPAVFQHYYQQAYLYGTVGGGGRVSEVFGERSDGAVSASSSRPVSALSSGSAAAAAAAAAGGGGGESLPSVSGQLQTPPPPIRIYSGPLARAAAAAAAGGQRPGSSAGTSGRNSPLATGGQPQQGSQLQTQLQQTTQQQQILQQQTGALPLQPFLGNQRRPSSATSRASGGTGFGCEVMEWGEQLPAAAAAGGGGGGRSGARTDSPSAAFPPGRGGAANGLLGSSLSISYGHAAALQHLQELQQAAAAAANGGGGGGGGFTATQPQPSRPVSVGSAHNHVRHTHSASVEAAGAHYSGFSGFQEMVAGERDQPGPQGSGPGPGGTGRGLVVSGSRPPSASAGPPASIRDKLQPGSGGTAAAAASGGGAAAVGIGGVAAAGGGGGPSQAVPRKQSFAAALNASSIAAAAAWDAAMAATAAAAGQDPSALMQYLGARSRPESAGHRLRPTSAASTAQRSPSPLGAMPSGAAVMAAALSGLGPGGGGAAAGSPGLSRNGSGRYGSADMFALGLTSQHTFVQQHAPQQPYVVVTGMNGGGGGGPGVGSPKSGGHLGGSSLASQSQAQSQSPRPPYPAAGVGTPPASAGSVGGGGGFGGGGLAVGPWDIGGTANGLGLAVGPAAPPTSAAAAAAAVGRAYKQQRATGVAPYPVLSARSGSTGLSAGTVGSAPSGYQPVAKRRSEGGGAGEDDGPAPVMYQTLSVPDAASVYASERYNGGVAVAANARHWSAASSSPAPSSSLSAAATAATSARQRSFTGAGGYVPVVVVTGATTGAGGPGGGAGGASSPSAGSLSARPPVYPPAGGSPGLRGAGAPSSGRAGGSGSVGLAKVALPPTNLAPSLPGAVPLPHAGVGMGMVGSFVARGGGGGSGSSTSIAALQSGIEGLQVTATGLDLDSQLRSAALAALNRKGLTVKGRKVAQQ
ncbi:hypothetical protein PLESTF_000287300 [Pleodorina starrii]|nr:hypothetical protein PLESTF_000287300 [Pleodorina starrii]